MKSRKLKWVTLMCLGSVIVPLLAAGCSREAPTAQVGKDEKLAEHGPKKVPGVMRGQKRFNGDF